MDDPFRSAEQEFFRLRRKFIRQEIAESEFRKRLKELRLQDKEGRFWTIGAQTGKWYYFDGNNWVQARPPSIQEKKAICIRCGFENELESESCAHCGNVLSGEEAWTCPRCGRKLDRFSLFCPDCEKEESDRGRDSSEWEAEEILKMGDEEGEGEKEERIPEAVSESRLKAESLRGRPVFVLRSVHCLSMVLFFGALGILGGVILGGVIGTSDFLPDVVRVLPPFMQDIHGTLIGGIFFGITGGFLGFFLMGLAGLLITVILNLVFSFMGGIKLYLE